MDNIYEIKEFTSVWQRLLYMLLFVFLYSIAELVLYAVASLQFLWFVALGEKNQHLLILGLGLSLWTCQVFQFLSFNKDVLPYPFNPWPFEQD